MASSHPEVDFLGVEVHTPGIGQALMGIDAQQLSNVRIIQHDAIEVLQTMLAPRSLARVLLFFPDPWRKKRHHKRRIVQPDFISLVANSLQQYGILHCATDWENYAHWMLTMLNTSEYFSNQAPANGFATDRPKWRTLTRFERRGERLGHTVYDLLYLRQ